MSLIIKPVKFQGGDEDKDKEVDIPIHPKNYPNPKKKVKFDEDYFYTIGDKDGIYSWDGKKIVNNHKWGQFKLMVTETQLLTIFYKNKKTYFVYVGAAEGYHTYTLAKLFPLVEFHLYDSREFYKKLYELKNVKIYNRYFNDDDVNKWYKLRENVIFYTDLRDLEFGDLDKKPLENEKLIVEDMYLQQDWVERIKPSVWSLKFRLPYYTLPGILDLFPEGFEYLKGKYIFRQPWTSKKSSETRLVGFGDDVSKKVWNLEAYEKILFYHNVYTRKMRFFNIIDGSEKILGDEIDFDDKFDATLTFSVFKKYLEKIGKNPTEKELVEFVKFIRSNISPKGDIWRDILTGQNQ